MAIGLNYTHVGVGDRLILPNYLYLLPNNYRPDMLRDLGGLEVMIQMGHLTESLESSSVRSKFDHPLIVDILREAYPYEIELKFLHKTVRDDSYRNERLIELFNTFFAINYHAELTSYCTTCTRDTLYQKSTAFSQGQQYQDKHKAVDSYVQFVEKLLRSQGFDREASALLAYLNTNMHITYEEGISGVTSEMRGQIYVGVGNYTYTTLYHELTHVINRFFRHHYYGDGDVCFDNYTKTNEGFANFVAYHLLDAILANSLDAVDVLILEPRYFSAYIDVYATLIEHGSNERKHNYDLVYQEMSKYELGRYDDQKADFYYQRFYKFFHYDQHRYFYPKEMMYYLGYHELLELFSKTKDARQLLTQCFLGKICL